jgi:hypothetical protein
MKIVKRVVVLQTADFAKIKATLEASFPALRSELTSFH